MSKRKAARASKQAGSKVATRAQRANEAVVRSSKLRHLRSVGPASRLEEPKVALAAPEKSSIASQDDSQRTMSENDIAKAPNVFSPTANAGVHQTIGTTRP
jgi:hypothetical protein